MLCSKRPVRALFVGVFLALAATASAQSFPAGLVGVADSQAGQLSLPPVTAGGQNPLDRASGEAALERRRQRANGDGSLLGDIARDYRSFFTTRETYRILAQGLGIALVLRPLDEPITTSRFNGELWENRALDRTFEGGEMLGGALLQVGGAFVTYGVGKVAGKPRLAELGRDLVRVQMLTQGVTQVIKYSVRRTRPDGSSNSSFPSGHTSGSFATATVLQRHYGWKAGCRLSASPPTSPRPASARTSTSSAILPSGRQSDWQPVGPSPSTGGRPGSKSRPWPRPAAPECR